MRSYEAARTYFSILGFLSWVVVIAGGLVAIIAAAAVGGMSREFGGSSMAGLAGIVPGVSIMVTGFMGLVLVQIGRAGVDTAEYTQQMLKIARDQLDVSKQAAKGPYAPANTYGGLAKDTTEARSTYETIDTSRENDTPEQRSRIQIEDASSHQNDPAVERGTKNGTLLLDGHRIEVENGFFYLNGEMFASLERAQAKLPAVLK